MKFIHQIIQALQTCTIDNLRYAPQQEVDENKALGDMVVIKTVSLAKKLEELYAEECLKTKPNKDQELMIRSIFLGTLARNQDTYKYDQNLEQWMHKVFLIGLEFQKEYEKK